MPEYTVKGQLATKPEFYLSRALDKAKINYIFQYQIWGGKQLRGGVVVDFLVLNPFAIPVEVFGEYWHTGQYDNDDRLRIARIQQHFKRQVVVFWGNELETQEEADLAVRDKLR